MGRGMAVHLLRVDLEADVAHVVLHLDEAGAQLVAQPPG